MTTNFEPKSSYVWQRC